MGKESREQGTGNGERVAAWAAVAISAVLAGVNIRATHKSLAAGRELANAEEKLAAIQTEGRNTLALAVQLGSDVDDLRGYYFLLKDIAAAEGGDRFAFKNAIDKLNRQHLYGDPQAQFLSKKLRYCVRRFLGDIRDNPDLAPFLDAVPGGEEPHHESTENQEEVK